jgi:hypothetical protein
MDCRKHHLLSTRLSGQPRLFNLSIIGRPFSPSLRPERHVARDVSPVSLYSSEAVKLSSYVIAARRSRICAEGTIRPDGTGTV